MSFAETLQAIWLNCGLREFFSISAELQSLVWISFFSVCLSFWILAQRFSTLQPHVFPILATVKMLYVSSCLKIRPAAVWKNNRKTKNPDDYGKYETINHKADVKTLAVRQSAEGQAGIIYTAIQKLGVKNF